VKAGPARRIPQDLLILTDAESKSPKSIMFDSRPSCATSSAGRRNMLNNLI